jgi:hypothetical protein
MPPVRTPVAPLGLFARRTSSDQRALQTRRCIYNNFLQLPFVVVPVQL